MSPGVAVKICGLSRPEDVDAAAAAGARFIGLVFFPRSPRNVSMEAAAEIARAVPPGLAKVALTVDASDAELDEILARVPLDMLQLHGGESPDRVRQVRERSGLPVMKAVGVGRIEDRARLDAYSGVADQILVDARPAPDAALPGGNGLSFDWRILQGYRWKGPWMLAGGLSPLNVAEAIRLTGARQVDVSSGVESAPGVKDAGLIRAFVEAATQTRAA
jgi:phosphoribosylanthranilate isomerase